MKKSYDNEMKLEFLSKSSNESFARITIAAFAAQLDPNIEEKSTRFAISASAGYDYQLTDWLSIGVNYTGWQIGYEYKNSANVKLGVIF